MEFKRSIIINRPAADVWAVLGEQYGQAYQWASGLTHSEGYGTPQHQGATCNNRSCNTTQGKIKEVIRVYDPEHYRLVYAVIEGFPFFVKEGVNAWTLTPEGQRTRVDMHLQVTTQGFIGGLMGPLMKGQMSKTVAPILNDLKIYVETGQPSPHKQQEQQRSAARA